MFYFLFKFAVRFNALLKTNYTLENFTPFDTSFWKIFLSFPSLRLAGAARFWFCRGSPLICHPPTHACSGWKPDLLESVNLYRWAKFALQQHDLKNLSRLFCDLSVGVKDPLQ